MTPAVVERPIFDAAASTNHRLLSGPTVIWNGCAPAVGTLYVTIVPVIEPPAPMPPVPGMPPTPKPMPPVPALPPVPGMPPTPKPMPPVPPPDMPAVPAMPPLPAPA